MTAYIEHLREGEEFVHRDPPARVALLDLKQQRCNSRKE